MNKYSYPQSTDPMCCIFLQWSKIPISRRQSHVLIFWTVWHMIVQLYESQAVILLAYRCSSVSECSPTESHQCKHRLFFFTLEMMLPNIQSFWIKQCIKTQQRVIGDTAMLGQYCIPTLHKQESNGSYFDLQHIQRNRFSSENGKSCWRDDSVKDVGQTSILDHVMPFKRDAGLIRTWLYCHSKR